MPHTASVTAPGSPASRAKTSMGGSNTARTTVNSGTKSSLLLEGRNSNSKKNIELTREEQKKLRSQRQPMKVFERPFENLNSKMMKPAIVAGDRSPNTGTIARIKNKSTLEAASGQEFDN